MKYLTINGKKEPCPAFPHHKRYIYEVKRFFRPKSFMTHVFMDRFIALGELLRGLRNGTPIPRVLLIDPTSSCNLHCKGCWAADYAKGDNLSREKLDDLFTQAEKLGIRYIMLSGGEPLMRKEDILLLCREHPKLVFGAFTNATLVDEAFADSMAQLENLMLFISIEGTREETDFRRGEGVYDRALEAMRLLKERNLAFAFSACYHAGNYLTIAGDDFLDDMRRRGCWFGWLFNYVPVGKDADISLVCSAQQRTHVAKHITDYCQRHDYLIIDFWNNGHTAYGCAAAGSGFTHINAKGDVEPCAFCHYSDSNIHDMTLVEALRSPFFTKFRAGQPFSDNPYRSCPMVDVPDALVSVVSGTGACSTHYSAPETAEELIAKTLPGAEGWKPAAETLMGGMSPKSLIIHRIYVRFLRFRRRITDERRK